MNCESVQTWLLRADGLEPPYWSPAVAEHMQTCSACNSLAYDLLKLEEDWRHRPIPAECASAQSAFLKTLPAHCFNPMPAPRRRFTPLRWAAAAAVLLVCAGVAWMTLSPGDIRASSDLVERLVDWNLDITTADLDQRHQFAGQEADFRQDLDKSNLTGEDRDLAEKLLENGRWLATNSDPLAEANRLTDLADNLIVKVDSATKKGNESDSHRFASCYSKIMEKGVHPWMVKIAKNKAFEGEKKVGFDQFMDRDEQHQQQVEKVIKQVPRDFRPDLRKKLEAVRKSFRSLQHGHKKKEGA